MSAGWKRVGAVIFACLMLAGCGSSGGQPAPEPTVVPATPATPEAPSGIGQIVWTLSVEPGTNAPVESLTSLPNDAPQIVAALPIETLPAGTVLSAQWTIDGDPLPALDTAPMTVGEGRVDAWVVWVLRRQGDQPWPIGRLGIIVSIDDTPWQQAGIPIVRANN